MPGVALAGALLLTTVSSPAQARALVVLLKEPAGSRFSYEILARLRGELAASDVELQVLDAPPGTPKEAVQGEWRDLDPDLVLLVDEPLGAGRRTEEIWLSDRFARRLFVQRVNADSADPARNARWVAVQAAELVRARIADSAIERAPEAPAPVRPPPLLAAPDPRLERFGLGVGLGVLHGFRGLSDTWAPLVRSSLSLVETRSLIIEACLAGGVGIERGLVYRAQRANVRQSFAVLGAAVRFAPRSWLQPVLSIGGGAYHVEVEGHTEPAYRNHRAGTWSMLNATGAGLRIAPFAGAALLLEATFMDVWSKTIVRFGPEHVIQIGAPIALFGATASAVF